MTRGWPASAHRRYGLAFGCLFALIGGSIGSGAPEGRGDVLEPLIGVYRNEAADGGRATVESATRAALEDAGPLVRRFAKPRILDNNPPFERLTIAREGHAVSVEYGGVRTYRAPLHGPPAKQRSPDGNDVEVRYRVQGSTLVELVEARRGRAVTTYHPEGDGLVMKTTITSPRLSTPVRFTMRFRPLQR